MAGNLLTGSQNLHFRDFSTWDSYLNVDKKLSGIVVHFIEVKVDDSYRINAEKGNSSVERH